MLYILRATMPVKEKVVLSLSRESVQKNGVLNREMAASRTAVFLRPSVDFLTNLAENRSYTQQAQPPCTHLPSETEPDTVQAAAAAAPGATNASATPTQQQDETTAAATPKSSSSAAAGGVPLAARRLPRHDLLLLPYAGLPAATATAAAAANGAGAGAVGFLAPLVVVVFLCSAPARAVACVLSRTGMAAPARAARNGIIIVAIKCRTNRYCCGPSSARGGGAT